MILVDANLLLYAYNSTSRFHEDARIWLENMLSKPEPVGLAWQTILAFLRIGTSLRVFDQPYTVEEAVAIVSSWLQRPAVVVLDPGQGHWAILEGLCKEAQARGPLMMDAHLAALAIEHGAVMVTTDRDFLRFPGLEVHNPLGAPAT